MSDTDQALGPPAVRPPTKRYEARRQAIIAAAVEAVNRRGVRGMTFGEISAGLNLVPTGVMYYFKNKEELAAAAFLKAIARFDQLMADSKQAPEAERLATFLRSYFTFCRDVAVGGAEPIAVFNDVRALDMPAVNEAYVDMFRRARSLLPRCAALARTERNARAHLLLSQLFWAPAWLSQWEPGDYPRVAERVIGLMLHGMTVQGRAWPNVRQMPLGGDGDAGAPPPSELFLKAATQLINDEGYHGASVERISAKLNVSKGAFYHHNDTKDELVAACFQRTFDIMWRAIHEAEAEGGSGLETLVAITSALVEHQMKGDAPLLRTSALTAVPESIRVGLMQKLHRITMRFSSIVGDGIADGSIRPVDASIAAEMITGAVNAAAELHFWAPGISADAVTDHYLKPLLSGLELA